MSLFNRQGCERTLALALAVVGMIWTVCLTGCGGEDNPGNEGGGVEDVSGVGLSGGVSVNEVPTTAGHDARLIADDSWNWVNKTSSTVEFLMFFGTADYHCLGDDYCGGYGVLNKNGDVGDFLFDSWYTDGNALYLVEHGDNAGNVTKYTYQILGNTLKMGNNSFTKMTADDLYSFKIPTTATMDPLLYGEHGHYWHGENSEEWYFCRYESYHGLDASTLDAPGHADNGGVNYSWYTIGNRLYLVDNTTNIFGGSPIVYTYSVTSEGEVYTLTLTDNKGVKTTWTLLNR